MKIQKRLSHFRHVASLSFYFEMARVVSGCDSDGVHDDELKTRSSTDALCRIIMFLDRVSSRFWSGEQYSVYRINTKPGSRCLRPSPDRDGPGEAC